MNLARADLCAQAFRVWLSPFAERLEVGGEIRRRRPEVQRMEMVCIPSYEEEKDLYGNLLARRNRTWREIQRRAEEEGWRLLNASQVSVKFLARDVEVLLFWTEASRWGTALMLSTGPQEHNLWIARYAESRGGKWHPGHGVYMHHRIIGDSEEAIYGALGLKPIPPDQREANQLPYGGLIRTPSQGGHVIQGGGR